MLNRNFIHFPDNVRLSLLIESNILNRIQNEKFIIAFSCDKMVQIPQKLLATLIRASSCDNVTVHIITCDELSEVYRKLPISEKDKIYVYNKNGEIFKPENK